VIAFDLALPTAPVPQRARVSVGPAPVGITLVSDDRLAVVANSNRFDEPTRTQTLSIFMVDDALSGRGPRVATVPVGAFPRNFQVDEHGRTLYLTNTNSRSLMVIDVAAIEDFFELPVRHQP
jgi:6-phosphogluconolactonase (cycloisomerase 2 family)